MAMGEVIEKPAPLQALLLPLFFIFIVTQKTFTFIFILSQKTFTHYLDLKKFIGNKMIRISEGVQD